MKFFNLKICGFQGKSVFFLWFRIVLPFSFIGVSPWVVYLCLEFSRLSSVRLRSHIIASLFLHLYLLISADGHCSVSDSSDDHRYRRENASIYPSRHGRPVNGGDAYGSTPSPSKDPPSVYLVVASVNVTEHVKGFVRCKTLGDLPGCTRMAVDWTSSTRAIVEGTIPPFGSGKKGF